jgi:hypothetical protein
MGNNEGRFYRPLDRDRRASIGCRSDERKFCDNKAGPSTDVRPAFTRNISAMARMAFFPSGGCVSAIFRMDSRHSSSKLRVIWSVPLRVTLPPARKGSLVVGIRSEDFR